VQQPTPELLEEMLRRRGIVAHDGVVRPAPLSSRAATVPPGVSGGASSSLSAATDISGTSASSAVDPALLEAARVDPAALDGVDDATADSILNELLAAGAITAGAYAAYKLARSMRNPASLLNATSVDDISNLPARTPDNENLVNALAQSRNGRRVVDGGTLRPVGDGPDSLKGAVAERKLTKPIPALPDYSGPAPATRAEIGARQSVQSRELPNNSRMIAVDDKYSDIPPELLAQVRARAQQLASERSKSREVVRNRKGAAQRRAGGPTADPEVSTLVNELVRIIRQNPNLTRVKVR